MPKKVPRKAHTRKTSKGRTDVRKHSMLVKSRTKSYVNNQGLRIAKRGMENANTLYASILDEAIDNAKQADRKTVIGKDFQKITDELESYDLLTFKKEALGFLQFADSDSIFNFKGIEISKWEFDEFLANYDGERTIDELKPHEVSETLDLIYEEYELDTPKKKELTKKDYY